MISFQERILLNPLPHVFSPKEPSFYYTCTYKYTCVCTSVDLDVTDSIVDADVRVYKVAKNLSGTPKKFSILIKKKFAINEDLIR